MSAPARASKTAERPSGGWKTIRARIGTFTDDQLRQIELDENKNTTNVITARQRTDVPTKEGQQVFRVILMATLAIASASCIATTYTKSITIRKDNAGQVLETIETETVEQRGNAYPVKLEHIQGVQP